MSKLQEFINLLQTTNTPQCKGCMGSGQSRCATGLGLEYFGYRLEAAEWSKEGYLAVGNEAFDDFARELGLASVEVERIMSWNDAGRTFKEIAATITQEFGDRLPVPAPAIAAPQHAFVSVGASVYSVAS